MTDNRTTELREKLDERGVDWIADDDDVLLVTRWKAENSKPAMYMEPVGECCEGWNSDFLFAATPEQAIATTLGSGECENTWDVELTGRLRFQCSECGAVSLEITPNYCPNCGAEVVDNAY